MFVFRPPTPEQIEAHERRRRSARRDRRILWRYVFVPGVLIIVGEAIGHLVTHIH